MEPKISVIVPIYNVDEYLELCILSIMNQTYPNLEIILIDDGSTDRSSMICDKYKNLDSRIIVYHKLNEGLSAARNSGIALSTGNLISLIDADDTIEPNMIEHLYHSMYTYNTDISFCDYYRKINVGDRSPIEICEGDNIIFSKEQLLDKLFSQEYCVLLPVAWNKLYKKEIFENIKYPIGRYHEDEFVIHNILTLIKKAVFVNKKLYGYQVREKSITNIGNTKMKNDKLDALQERTRFFKDIKQDYYYKKSVEYFLKHAIWECLKLDDSSKEDEIFVIQQSHRMKQFLINNKNSNMHFIDKVKAKIFAEIPFIYIYGKKFLIKVINE